MRVSQDKNEYHIFFYGTNERPILGISKIIHNGEPYIGKKVHHSICLDCGKIIGMAMGGFSKHAKSCKLHNEEWAKSEIQRLYDKHNWQGMNSEESSFYKWLNNMVDFTPKYNCPA